MAFKCNSALLQINTAGLQGGEEGTEGAPEVAQPEGRYQSRILEMDRWMIETTSWKDVEETEEW